MKRRVCLSLAVCLSSLLGASAAYADDTVAPANAPSYRYMQPSYGHAPLPKYNQEVWYGWQTLIILGTSSVLLALSPVAAPVTFPLGLGGASLGGPIVHWAHGHGLRGLGVLGMHLGGTALGGLFGVGGYCGMLEGCGRQFQGFGVILGMMVGGGVGLLTTNIVDIVAFSSEKRPLPPAAFRDPPKPRFFALPTLDIRKDRAVLGVIGSF